MKKILFLLISGFSFLFAQTPQISLSSDSLMLGEICTMNVFFDKDAKSITLLNPAEWVGGVRFRDAKEIFTEGEEKIFQMQLSFYETPICTIPPISFSVFRADSTTDTLITEPIVVRIPSMFEKLDTNQLKKIQTYGLSNPMKAGKMPLREIAIILFILAIVIILLILLIKKLLREKFEEKPPVPPFEEAMTALLELDNENLIGKGEYKQFVFSLSHILKRFVSRRFDVPIEEATSTEFKQWTRKSDLSRENKILLEKFINETDPVKFADLTPSIDILRELRKSVEEFVKITRPIEVSEKQ